MQLIKSLEDQEMDRAIKDAQQKIQTQVVHMSKKHQNEFTALQKKLNTNIEEHERERKQQLAELVQRYFNLSAKARRQADLEKARLEQRLEIKHKSITLVGKLEGVLCHHDSRRVPPVSP